MALAIALLVVLVLEGLLLEVVLGDDDEEPDPDIAFCMNASAV